MVSWDGLNRRKFPRINFPCLIVLQHGDGKEDVYLAHTENVGIGGICVILKHNIKMFQEVDLELDLLDLGDHIKCKGKVVWSIRRKTTEAKKPAYYDIGVEFKDVKKEDQNKLDVVIKRLIKNHKELPEN